MLKGGEEKNDQSPLKCNRVYSGLRPIHYPVSHGNLLSSFCVILVTNQRTNIQKRMTT